MIGVVFLICPLLASFQQVDSGCFDLWTRCLSQVPQSHKQLLTEEYIAAVCSSNVQTIRDALLECVKRRPRALLQVTNDTTVWACAFLCSGVVIGVLVIIMFIRHTTKTRESVEFHQCGSGVQWSGLEALSKESEGLNMPHPDDPCKSEVKAPAARYWVEVPQTFVAYGRYGTDDMNDDWKPDSSSSDFVSMLGTPPPERNVSTLRALAEVNFVADQREQLGLRRQQASKEGVAQSGPSFEDPFKSSVDVIVLPHLIDPTRFPLSTSTCKPGSSVSPERQSVRLPQPVSYTPVTQTPVTRRPHNFHRASLPDPRTFIGPRVIGVRQNMTPSTVTGTSMSNAWQPCSKHHSVLVEGTCQPLRRSPRSLLSEYVARVEGTSRIV
eukprot:Blabericola_migrator_1__610@NODE_114_length_13851_cov_137_870429_g102_i0_p4_GENE_NODE_114_length_13851_cov_137_870429_g102_i0NODE_114_length_13851_cov_137_870429_g102_i0_p4_ORF_typecomplete_len382_score38_90DnaT/PF17948_1/0_84DnaT/PF17948_1/1_9e02_NODE_114_length_13851_cov_137_870429_g102_i01265813803